MYFFYILVAVTLSTGLGAFAAFDAQTRVAMRSDAAKAELAHTHANYMMRALRRQLQMNPEQLPEIPERGSVSIPVDTVENHYFGGYRPIGLVSFVVDSTGAVVANIRESAILYDDIPGNDGAGSGLEDGKDIEDIEVRGPDGRTRDRILATVALGQIDAATMADARMAQRGFVPDRLSLAQGS